MCLTEGAPLRRFDAFMHPITCHPQLLMQKASLSITLLLELIRFRYGEAEEGFILIQLEIY